MNKLLWTILLAGSALAAPPQYTPQQIKDCVALQYLLNPSPSMEIKAVHWVGHETNQITWSAEGADWELSQVIHRLGKAVHGQGMVAGSSYVWHADEQAGWGELREDVRYKSAKQLYDALFYANVAACQTPTLGLIGVPPGDLVMDNGKLTNKAWIQPENGGTEWAMGEFTLDPKGRLASIKWRGPNEFRPDADRYWLVEYQYDQNEQVPAGVPTGWMVRIMGQAGPSTPEQTQVLAWNSGTQSNPQKLSPETVKGIRGRSRTTDLGEEDLINGQWRPYQVPSRAAQAIPTETSTPELPLF